MNDYDDLDVGMKYMVSRNRLTRAVMESVVPPPEDKPHDPELRIKQAAVIIECCREVVKQHDKWMEEIHQRRMDEGGVCLTDG